MQANLRDDIKAMIIDASEGNLTPGELDAVGDDIAGLGMDSLAIIRIMVLIEEKFDIQMDMEENDPAIWRSLTSLCEYVGQQLSMSTSPGGG